jgi:hypothetical protein
MHHSPSPGTPGEGRGEGPPRTPSGALSETALTLPSPGVPGEGKTGRAPASWRDVFGDGAEGEEVFTAWHFARYMNEIVRRGKAEYPLPMFVNAALNRPGRRPGEYPSGGPLPHLLEVWHAAAPLLDMLSPDVYFLNFAEWTEKYRRPGNPIFVPEAMRSARAAANAFFAIGQQGAIGFSPFGIESMAGPDAERLSQTYSALRHLAPQILERQGKGALFGVSPKVGYDGSVDATPQELTIGRYALTITFDATSRSAPTTAPTISNDPATRGHDLPPAGGMIISTGADADEYTVVGTGLTIMHAVIGGEEQAGLLEVDEWTEKSDGTWSRSRRLNGDQTHQGRHLQLPSGSIGMQHVRLYRYR